VRTRRRLAVALAAIGLGLVALFVWEKSSPSVSPPSVLNNPGPNASPPAPAPNLPAAAPATRIDPAQVRVATSLPDGISLLPESAELVADLNHPRDAPDHDLEIVENLITTYRGIFGSNPPGGLNTEIVAAMLGANPRKLAIIPRDLAALSPSGELLDRWGTPFLFHPVSDEIMEVMSAGPDQILWTPDDVGKITPANEQSPQEL